MKEIFFQTFKFSKSYLYGFALMFLVPRTWFDQMAITYYDIMEPETTHAPNAEKTGEIPTEDK